MKFTHHVLLWSLIVLCALPCFFRSPLGPLQARPNATIKGIPGASARAGRRNITAPALTGGNVMPSMSISESTKFTFPVTYTDGTNDAPVHVNSIMNSQISQPVLYSPSVTPLSAIEGSLFTFRITYSDSSNTAPSYVRLKFRGSLYSMYKEYYNCNYVDGCGYYYSLYLSKGNYTYSFTASNGYYTKTTYSFSGPSVNSSAIPSLLNASATPTIGNSATMFKFRVVYVQTENFGPSSVRL